MSEAPPVESPDDEPLPRRSSFVIGCGIGLGLTVVAAIFVMTVIRNREFERSAETQRLVQDLAGRLETLQKSGRLPLAKGLGSDFSGQEALKKAGVEFPKDQMVRGLLCDAWEHPIIYRCGDGQRYQLYSCGPNGRDDNGEFDDIPATVETP